MQMIASPLLVLIAGAWLVSAEIYWEPDVLSHMEHLASPRFPDTANNEERLKAQQYIKERFTDYGLRIKEQKFNTSIRIDQTGQDYTEEIVEGTNIIGISEAVQDKPGAVILIGADYDTNLRDNPMYNNGAGVAAMLETARMFMHNTHWSAEYLQNYTTIFVAFDLNTREHAVGSDKPGGQHFVNEWLWPFLNQSETNFGGAFILDSIMNLNINPGAQTLGPDFQQLFPDTFDRVTADQKKGNFLGMVTQDNEKSKKLKMQFSGNYNYAKIRQSFRLEDMGFSPNVPFNNMLQEFTKQETIHFWTFQVNNNYVQLPAILLTDTEQLRELPANPESCQKACRPKDLLTEDKVEFMDATIQALLRTLMRRQASKIERPDPTASAITSLPSLLMTMVLLFMVRLFK